jgi:tetratricopeptide (TPR) repeat protein
VNPGFLLLAASFLPALPAAGTSLGASGAGLGAAAAASGRPKECMSGSRRALAKGPSIWESAREPSLARYCDLMARAQTELSAQPDAAKTAAIEADRALPGRAAPQVVLARAELALGSLEGAAHAFEKARGIEPRSVEDPGTMHDLARVLARTGKREEALAVYRALVPRVDLLGTPDRRISVLIEAAHVSMAAEAAGTAASPTDVGKKGARGRLDEAAAYLREARQRPVTQLAGDVLLSLALVLDRAGDREQADAALAEAQRSGDAVRFRSTNGKPRPLDYLAAPEDALALAALAAEDRDRVESQKAWEAFLAGPGGKGAWAAAAKTRLDAVKKGAVAKAASPKREPARPAAPKSPQKR